MKDVETLKAVYAEKEAKHYALCDAVAAAYEALQAIKALCEEAMADKLKAGEELLKAMEA